ncbi:hypothetical protein ACHZ98_27545 [Streptomyces sp. MAR4 CNY-716]
MRRLTRALTALAATAALAFTAVACTDDSSQAQESRTKQSGYDRMVQRQPANAMTYSPTRETINKWVDNWEKPGKLSYVYLQNANGEYGYFVLEGLPVSYCAMLTPPEDVDTSSTGMVTKTAPGMDGVYYSGGQCSAYYGFDATTGAYLEFTIGSNQSFFLYDKPMALPEFRDATPLGETRIEDGKIAR